MDARAVLAAHALSAGARDDHALNRNTVAFDDPRNAQPPQDLERPRVDGIAAQLVARKDRAVEQSYADPRARQQQGGDCARGTRPRDEHLVTHRPFCRDREDLPMRFDHGAARLDRALQHASEVHVFASKFEPSRRDAR